jgi:hypothetical protein
MRKSRQPRGTAAKFVAAARQGAEAAGEKPKFEGDDFSRAIGGSVPPIMQTIRMARS